MSLLQEYSVDYSMQPCNVQENTKESTCIRIFCFLSFGHLAAVNFKQDISKSLKTEEILS